VEARGVCVWGGGVRRVSSSFRKNKIKIIIIIIIRRRIKLEEPLFKRGATTSFPPPPHKHTCSFLLYNHLLEVPQTFRPRRLRHVSLQGPKPEPVLRKLLAKPSQRRLELQTRKERQSGDGEI
jgi:hypothetical protein